MAKIYKPNEIGNLMNDIKKRQEEALLIAGKNAFEVMQRWLLEEVYTKVPESGAYHRTEELLKSLTLSPIIKSGNTMSIRVYIPNETFNDYAHAMMYDVPSLGLSMTNNPTASQVMMILEEGLNPYRPNALVMEKTLEELKYANKVFKDLQNYMKSQGYNII